MQGYENIIVIKLSQYFVLLGYNFLLNILNIHGGKAGTAESCTLIREFEFEFPADLII